MRWPRGLRSKALVLALTVAAPPAAADLAFVTNQSSSDLSVLDLATRTELRRIPVPGGPAGVAVMPALGTVFTVSPKDASLRAFDLKSGAARGVLQLEGGPIGIAGHGDMLFVSDWYNARIWQIDALHLRLHSTLATGAAPAGLALSEDGRWLVSADRDADAISVFDRSESPPARRSYPTGTRPFAVTFGPDGLIYTADVGSDSITLLDPETGAIKARLATGPRPYGVAFAAGRIFVSDQYGDTVSVFDGATRAPLTRIDVGEYPEGIAAFDDGHKIVVTNWFSNSVHVIDAQTLAIEAEIDTGDGPRAFGNFILKDSP